ncbi:hypothetical protein DM860_017575 [Cuscuta australis]|uniref:DUF4283 domain-containing protein n=1 Tax=Cuscuta australis TaxID=267555 RepID=A0A328D9I3_9ASTE|nr:hypothetical protein DM860_017575 [Cuscuta australis]
MRKRGRPPKTDGKPIMTDNFTAEEPPEKEIPSDITSGHKTKDEDSGFTGTLDPDPNMIKANKTVTKQSKSYAEVVAIQDELNLDLKYIPAEIIDGTPVARFSTNDIIEPGEYWESALICCVLGANPSLEVIRGFLTRIWKLYEIDDVSLLKESQFIVRLKKKEDRDEIVKRKYYYMDKKPVYVQQWYPGCKVDIMNRKDIPIWIQFPELEMKYWSLTGLSRLGSTIGKPIKRDGATASRRKWAYARIMIEVHINQSFPDQVNFINEEGRVITQNVTYEWAPTICSHCDRMGHKQENCRRKSALKVPNGTKKWYEEEILRRLMRRKMRNTTMRRKKKSHKLLPPLNWMGTIRKTMQKS